MTGREDEDVVDLPLVQAKTEGRCPMCGEPIKIGEWITPQTTDDVVEVVTGRLIRRDYSDWRHERCGPVRRRVEWTDDEGVRNVVVRRHPRTESGALVAEHESRCPLCEGTIRVGDAILLSDAATASGFDWGHEVCPTPRGTSTCPRCFLERPCPCEDGQ